MVMCTTDGQKRLSHRSGEALVVLFEKTVEWAVPSLLVPVLLPGRSDQFQSETEKRAYCIVWALSASRGRVDAFTILYVAGVEEGFVHRRTGVRPVGVSDAKSPPNYVQFALTLKCSTKWTDSLPTLERHSPRGA